MSRYAKRKIIQLIEQLMDLNQKLRTDDFPKESILMQLAEFQSAAIDIGNRIEQLWGKNTKAVSELECYCESVYQVYQKYEEGFLINSLLSALPERLETIMRTFRDEIEEKYQVVFLPYKASMWDALESIWQAASNDKQCSPLVIPIPYYDKNQDGTLGQEHYEGENFPEYVPIVDYQEVDLNLWQPDVIYIHNPYDNCNRITTVHPSFYAKNLRNFTENLVYVPYFTLNGEFISEELAILPAVLYANYVIVRNEQEKKEYVSRFLEQEIQIPIIHKLLPLGSPKLDRVKLMEENLIDVPPVWKERAGNRKVIFYNTSIGEVLKEKDVYIEKMCAVFRAFQARNDVILLWRPHPLMEPTIKSIGEELYRRYVLLKSKFLCENIGIYDDSKDMSAAISFSDAYYGDVSSVAWIYAETGKRVLFQNVGVREEHLYVGLDIADMVCTDEIVYFTLKNGIGIWKYLIHSHMFQVLSCELMNMPIKYRILIEDSEKLILPPYAADDITICDKNQGTMTYIPVLRKTTGQGDLKFYKGAVRFQQYFYLIGDVKSSLLRYDSLTHEILDKSEWKKDFEEQYGHSTEIYYHIEEVCVVKNSFYAALTTSNMVMEFDMENEKAIFHKIGQTSMKYATICFDGKNFWLSGAERVLVCWNKETGQTKEYDKFPELFALSSTDKFKDFFCASLPVGKFVYFAPLKGNMIIRINTLTGEIECVKNIGIENVCMLMKPWYQGMIFFQISDEFETEKKEDFILDLEHRVINRNLFYLNGRNMTGIEKCFYDSNVTEEMTMGYLEYLLDGETGKMEPHNQIYPKESAGESIYNRIKQEGGK